MATLPSQVRPGDVISSDLFNRLLAEVIDLGSRVSDLEGAPSPSALRIFNVTGPTPIRVNNRATAIGEGFSRPAGLNTITVDGRPVTSISEGASDDTHLSFDVPDPGLGSTGRDVVLLVRNAALQSGTFSFRLEPAIAVPFGTITLLYDRPPVASGLNLVAGTYEFGYSLSVDVDKNVTIRLRADLGSVAGWQATLLADDGSLITAPIPVARTPGTLRFKVRVTVPSTGAGTANLQVGAEETTSGTRVSPSSAPVLALTRDAAIPVPETRVAARLQGFTDVVVSGGQVTYTRGLRGELNFGFTFSLGTGFTGSTSISWAFSLDPTTGAGWNIESPQTSGVTLNGASGTGATRIGLTPSSTAGATRLALRVTASPVGLSPIDITYVLPLLV